MCQQNDLHDPHHFLTATNPIEASFVAELVKPGNNKLAELTRLIAQISAF